MHASPVLFLFYNVHIYIVRTIELLCIASNASGRFAVFHNPMRTVLSENASFSRLRCVQSVTMVGGLSTQIMNKNTTCTDIVSVEVLDFEVEDLNRLGQLLAMDGIDEGIFAVLKFQLVVQLQILRSNPALALYVEGMLGSTGDGFAIDLYMYQFILLVPEGANDTLQRPPISGRPPQPPDPRSLYQILSNGSALRQSKVAMGLCCT